MTTDDTQVEAGGFHDLRRSMATNMYEAGVDRSVIKVVGGWKSDSMFERYRQLFPDKAQPKAMAKLVDYLEAEQGKDGAENVDKLTIARDKLTTAEKPGGTQLATARPN